LVPYYLSTIKFASVFLLISILKDPNAAAAATAGGQSHSRVKTETNDLGLTPEQLKNKVFVGGLPLHVDKDGLKDFFSVFGPVTDAVVMMDMMAQRSRGFGFITFENGSNGAQKAIEAQPINMFGKMVEVKLATPKGDREGGGGGAGPNLNHQTFQKPVMAPSLRSTGEFAGLASAYGRAGWRAGYGSKAFGKAGWNVVGWDDGGAAPERSGFSFSMLPPSVLDPQNTATSNSDGRGRDEDDSRPTKRARQ
jgi:RNA recognition motif-containing protein